MASDRREDFPFLRGSRAEVKERNVRQDKAWFEKAAAAENQWVRAVVLKDDHVAHSDARKIATEASEMARNALGASHTLYGASLLNLAIYYEVIEKNSAEAERRYQEARRILGNDHPEYVEAMYWLGVYQFSAKDGRNRAAEVWGEALAIFRRAAKTSVRMADLLVCLSAYHISDQPKKAAQELREALEIQRRELGAGHKEVRATESRLAAALRAAAGVE
jgi:hypothetical protein